MGGGVKRRWGREDWREGIYDWYVKKDCFKNKKVEKRNQFCSLNWPSALT